MTDAAPPATQRDRSPAYPNIPLKVAIDRLIEFDTHFKRTPARPEKIGDAWGITAKAYVDRTTAALRYYGLLEYQGVRKERHIVTSDWGKAYLRSAQEETKRTVIKKAALLPKHIAFFWTQWGTDRPADAACLDELMFKHKFSEGGARDFLKVYDATITFAGLTSSDKPDPNQGDSAEPEEETEPEGFTSQPNWPWAKPPAAPPPQERVNLMAGERVVFTEESNPQNYLKLIASGDVDETMLEALEDYVKRQKKRLIAFGSMPDHVKNRERPSLVDAAKNVGPDADRLAAAEKNGK